MSPSPTSQTTGETSRYLLDTHAFLWAATDDGRLTDSVRRLLLEPGTDLFLSVASVWEMAIKKSLGKLWLQIGLGELVAGQVEAMRIRVLEVTPAHALGVENLPFHHRDPFDRLLASQALHERLAIISADSSFDAYPAERIW